MNGSYLLDTNIVIAYIAQEKQLVDRVHAAQEVYIPFIVVGELYYGAYKSAKVSDNEKVVDLITTNLMLLEGDSTTAKWYGKIKQILKTKGMPIPENDIWIAALALQYNLTLVTRDKHFNNIPNITIVQW